MNARKYNVTVIVSAILLLIVLSLPTIVIDPYFHYHKPLNGLAYTLEDERYQNNGITRNFTYNAMITGTSMTENFKTSIFDEIFEVNSIKVPFAGGYFKEIDSNILVGLKNNPELKTVLRGLDFGFLVKDKDAEFSAIEEQGYNYPYYLLDNNPFNDVSYVLNKEVLSIDNTVVRNTMGGNAMTTFDEYKYWIPEYTFGKEAVLATFERPEAVESIYVLPEEDDIIERENIRQNVVATARMYPDTIFYYFFTPYSICEWDMRHQRGTVDYCIDVEKIAIEEILSCPNIKLFSFDNDFDMICDLSNYKDPYHYGEEVNKQIMNYIKEGKYL